jgi:hypothetical protein
MAERKHEEEPMNDPAASHHHTWRERIGGHSEYGPAPIFEPSDDPTLLAFALLYADSDLISFDVNKHLRTDALSPLYDCETESVRELGEAPELFVAIWTPVRSGTDAVTGFRTGHDSAYLGSTPTVAMPQDERTAALLLVVTTSFVHLSARREASMLVVQGAIDDVGEGFRYVELVPDAVPGGALRSPEAASGEST